MDMTTPGACTRHDPWLQGGGQSHRQGSKGHPPASNPSRRAWCPSEHPPSIISRVDLHGFVVSALRWSNAV